MTGLFLHVLCRRDMPFLEKLADIAMSGRHVGDMSATFPAKELRDVALFKDPPPRRRTVQSASYQCQQN
jgi:hypothetical protein